MNYYELYHGDYKEVLDHISVDLVVTSPPYNIGSSSPAKTGRRKHGKYDPKSFRAIMEYPDSLPEEKYQESQIDFLKWCEQHLNKDGIIAYNHKERRKNNVLISPLDWINTVDSLVKVDHIVWDRGSTHNHCTKTIWPITEDIWILKRPDDNYKLNNRKDRMEGLEQFRANVWRIPRAPVNGHNAPFPIKLPDALIKMFSEEGDSVCDPYMGSGTTAEAALRNNRDFYGAELLGKYYDMSVRRIKQWV